MNHASYYNSRKQNLSQSNNFYEALAEKYQTAKQTQPSGKQSRARCNSRVERVKGNKKTETKQQKEHLNRNILFVPNSWSTEQVYEVLQNYALDKVITQPDKLTDVVLGTILAENPKFISLCVLHQTGTKQGQNLETTKSARMQSLIQPLARIFEKATICIYSLAEERKNRIEYFDMLSIRRQIKTDLKLLVQTNICNNSKSGVILRKLVDVAKQREKLMAEETPIKIVVIKLKGLIPVPNQTPKEIQIQLSVGGYGEIGNKDLMGAEKFRIYYNLIQAMDCQDQSEVKKCISCLRRKQKQKVIKESELIEKIKNLQNQLIQKKKQLEEQKQRAAKDEEIEAQLEDIVLPSQRPMVNIDKYETRVKVGSTKTCFRVGNS